MTPGAAAPAPRDQRRPARIFLVAGEPSGDRLGASLMAALRRKLGDVAFSGIGGEHMTGEGLQSLFPMRELTLMGFAEVVPHLPRLMRRLRETAAKIRALRPDLVVTIDSPGFNARLLDRLRGSGIATAHYGAPAVWAWRPGRLRHWVGRVDRLLAILPFEPAIFRAAGIDCHYVGHPVLERRTAGPLSNPFRQRFRIPPQAPLIGLLPGSRRSELRHLLPVLKEVADRLHRAEPGAHFVMPTLPGLIAELSAAVASWPQPPLLVGVEQDRSDAYGACDIALAASGTVTLELAAAGTPMIIIYRSGRITAALIRRMALVQFAGLPNLLLSRPLVPELLQEACEPDGLVNQALSLLRDPQARAAQKAGFQEIMAQLAIEGSPSDRAATLLAELLARPAA
ncbi:lipid-A-disaccharide synthase [Hypericibacter terrae]|nr:lipid-A-disaccharide synthase [Hypericibacter terrae]